jgi:DNA-binding NtrC family response regulator
MSKDTLNESDNNDQELFSHLVGKSLAMQQVLETIARISSGESNVLITGKSGTGKELAAKAIHFNSPRKKFRFVALSCGAIQEAIFESELFGHKRGAFTGAIADKEGLFLAAEGGSLFLDEISEMSLAVQAKLLRAIETKQILPVGGTDLIQMNVRILAATNRNLREQIAQGMFREDLYYRLNVIELHLPSLSERREDIPLLARHFMEKYNRQMNKKVLRMDPSLVDALMQKEWKGEVRELENTIERLMIMTDGPVLLPDALPVESGSAMPPHSHFFATFPLKKAVQLFERAFIIHQLEQHHFHRGKTAKALGIGEATLYRKMSQLGIKG